MFKDCLLKVSPLILAGLLGSLAAPTAFALPGDAGMGPVSSPSDTVGPNPRIGPVENSLIPTMKIAPAKGWPAEGKPRAADGIADDAKGIKGKVMSKVQARAGAGTPSANRIVLLRDADGDGVAETKTVFIDHLDSPFGMALIGTTLFVADSDAVLKFPYVPGETTVTAKGIKVTDLPAGRINHHWTKNIIASTDGSKLYATVGSNSNAAENGMAAEEGRAAIWEIDVASGEKTLYATGLRNANGMAWKGGTLWAVANERDELGNDLVPDYLTSVKKNAFYGWPYSYYGQHVDTRVKPPRPDLVAKAISPDYALGAHVAAFTGFVSAKGEAYGRPVGVAIDAKGALLVADDVGNVVWRAVGAAR